MKRIGPSRLSAHPDAGQEAAVDLQGSGEMLRDYDVVETTDHSVKLGFTSERSSKIGELHDRGTKNMPARRWVGVPSRWVMAALREAFRRLADLPVNAHSRLQTSLSSRVDNISGEFAHETLSEATRTRRAREAKPADSIRRCCGHEPPTPTLAATSMPWPATTSPMRECFAGPRSEPERWPTPRRFTGAFAGRPSGPAFTLERALPHVERNLRTFRERAAEPESSVETYLAVAPDATLEGRAALRGDLHERTELLVLLLDERYRERAAHELRSAPVGQVRDRYLAAVATLEATDMAVDERCAAGAVVRFVESEYPKRLARHAGIRRRDRSCKGARALNPDHAGAARAARS